MTRPNTELSLALALDEYRRRLAEARFRKYFDTASQKQLDFHGAQQFGRVILGANRSGKSEAGAVETNMWAWYSTDKRNMPRVTPLGRIIPVGPVYMRIVCPELPSTMDKPHVQRDKFRRITPPHWLRGGSFLSAYSVLGHTLHYANGSIAEFMSSEQSTDKHAGQSIHGIWFDEEMPKQIYTENLARLDQTDSAWWFTYTPIMGLRWIYDEIYVPAMRGDPGLFLRQIDIEDNRRNLGKQFIEKLEKGLSEDEKSLRLRGRYSVNTGLVYDIFGADDSFVDVQVVH